MEYYQGTEAIYQNQVVKVLINYTEKKECKIISKRETKNVSYSELTQIMSKEEADARLQEKLKKQFENDIK
jgi:hypothetical protein